MTIPRLYADDPPSSRRGPDRSPEARAQASSRVGQVLASKYRLDAVVGSGGMGHVYRATNAAIGRTVAIKLLRPELAQNADIVERFLREARTANRVDHPNVVDVTDIGQDADGTPFIVQEFLEGETLLDHAARQGGRLTLTELTNIIGPVLSAVAAAHRAGIVHRDLKPENVFLSGRRGRRIPKVLDFGISKARGSESELTQVGVMMGTPAYMPPELVVSFRDADKRADVWSLGVIVFEMLAGRLPFEGATVGEIFHAVATTDAERLSDWADVPEALADVVARCLKRDPDERYPDAEALAIALARAIEEREPDAAKLWSLRPPKAGGTDAAEVPAIPEVPFGLTTLKVDGDRGARGATIPLATWNASVAALQEEDTIEEKGAAEKAMATVDLTSTLPSESATPASLATELAEVKADERPPPSAKPTVAAEQEQPVRRRSMAKRIAASDALFVVAVIVLVVVVALVVASTVR